MKIVKIASQVNRYRDRATIFLHDGKGNVLAAHQAPSATEAPYHFPGGGIHEKESIHNPIPSDKKVNKGLHREALEELGYKLKSIESFNFPPSEITMSPEWQARVQKKRGELYYGIREHMRAAQAGKRDLSLYNSEGDAFERFNPKFTPAKQMADALRKHSKNPFVSDGKRENMIMQAAFLDEISKKYSKGK
jgi:8-oxo-dGTP pyrophosphatase MutT (NUDIX family)